MCNHIVWGCLFLITSQSTSQFQSDLTEGERSQNIASSQISRQCAGWLAGLQVTWTGQGTEASSSQSHGEEQRGHSPIGKRTIASSGRSWMRTISSEKHACPEGCELQLRRAWRCLQLAHVWAEEDRVCSEPWLPERVELSAEKPPAPRSAGAEGSSAGRRGLPAGRSLPSAGDGRFQERSCAGGTWPGRAGPPAAPRRVSSCFSLDGIWTAVPCFSFSLTLV